jgi:hypothetical protein
LPVDRCWKWRIKILLEKLKRHITNQNKNKKLSWDLNRMVKILVLRMKNINIDCKRGLTRRWW